MVILSPLKTLNFPMKTKISKMNMETNTRLMAQNNANIYAIKKNNISMKNFSNKNVLPRVTLKDNYVSDEIVTKVEEGVQRIKDIMARKLQECCHAEELVIIDAIQRLNLGYYFQDEIGDALRKHYERFDTEEGGHDLHNTALCFRLLRQGGYNVSADIFSKFTDEKGNFKQELEKDIKGLLSLYEASHLGVPGDHILDSAGSFSRHLLSNFDSIEPYEASIIQNTLSLPCHKSLPIFMAADFLQNFEISMKILHDCSRESRWMEEIRNLARIDINRSQMSAQHEINEICRWWDELPLPKEQKDTRNQPVKWHMWSLACLQGPHMAESRLELTKVTSFIYTIDDIYDIFGTLDELTQFTEAVNRWECVDFDNMPDYMITSLKALFDTTNEICHKIYMKHGFNPEKYIRKSWAEFCDECLLQAKWIESGYIPTTEEYMKSAIGGTGLYVGHALIFFLLGKGFTDKKCKDVLSSHPDICYLAARILRLWDDLGSSEDEHQKYNGSVMECYMNEHKGSSPETAREYVFAMISDAWSRLNENLLSTSPFSADFKAVVANFARLVPVMYTYDKNHRLRDLEKHMKPLVNTTSKQFKNVHGW
ncbi:hypothetical protein RND81_06G123200 [Saponaria officinalis]|uniref:Uncharacterized protein n=1 Tax=Saponaria officinalis TaxID=3572 RepID=A0AAW1KCC2_SAPOF